MEINYSNSNNTIFTAKTNSKKILQNIKPVFQKHFPNLQSPSRASEFEELAPEGLLTSNDIRELNKRLHFVRKFVKSMPYEDEMAKYFRNLFAMIKMFNVANCAEYAEMTKIILKLNNFKNADIFSLYVKKANGVIKELDHAIIALNISKSKNNKKSQKMFVPSKNTQIIDMWWPGVLIKKLKNAKKSYRQIGVDTGDTIMLKPVRTYEPDKKSFQNILKDFPGLKF